ncbi:putative signal peptide protein [Puccinia sorghi]|uniref:Putative signal peptide protein n=1 Tax=Puccinia sorghi TaxID=27349 RepID=A0A0L6VQJ8_9BASI|nr:putative signal peptide protein [Puccinia sorghi]
MCCVFHCLRDQLLCSLLSEFQELLLRSVCCMPCAHIFPHLDPNLCIPNIQFDRINHHDQIISQSQGPPLPSLKDTVFIVPFFSVHCVCISLIHILSHLVCKYCVVDCFVFSLSLLFSDHQDPVDPLVFASKFKICDMSCGSSDPIHFLHSFLNLLILILQQVVHFKIVQNILTVDLLTSSSLKIDCPDYVVPLLKNHIHLPCSVLISDSICLFFFLLIFLSPCFCLLTQESFHLVVILEPPLRLARGFPNGGSSSASATLYIPHQPITAASPSTTPCHLTDRCHSDRSRPITDCFPSPCFWGQQQRCHPVIPKDQHTQKDLKMGKKNKYQFRFRFSTQNYPRSLPYKTPEISTLLKEKQLQTFME